MLVKSRMTSLDHVLASRPLPSIGFAHRTTSPTLNGALSVFPHRGLASGDLLDQSVPGPVCRTWRSQLDTNAASEATPHSSNGALGSAVAEDTGPLIGAGTPETTALNNTLSLPYQFSRGRIPTPIMPQHRSVQSPEIVRHSDSSLQFVPALAARFDIRRESSTIQVFFIGPYGSLDRFPVFVFSRSLRRT